MFVRRIERKEEHQERPRQWIWVNSEMSEAQPLKKSRSMVTGTWAALGPHCNLQELFSFFLIFQNLIIIISLLGVACCYLVRSERDYNFYVLENYS